MSHFIQVEHNPFDGPEIEDALATTDVQREIILACIIGGNEANLSYNESITIELFGKLNKKKLLDSVQVVLNRHEAFRTVFSSDGEQTIILKEVVFNLFEKDFSDYNEIEKANLFKSVLFEDANHTFNLLNGPLIRLTLIKLREERHYFVITAHHIICDGWSFGVFIDELSKLYNNDAKDILPLAPTYSNYALEISKLHLSTEYEKTEQYWLSQFTNDIPLIDLPSDFIRPSIKTYKSKRDDFKISKELTTLLKKTGIKLGVSLVNTILASFEIFLAQLLHKNDIVIGMPAAGQSSSGYFGLIGHCVNLLPIRTTINKDLSFSDFLKNRKEKFLNDLDHQEISFGSLLTKLNIPRDPSRVPLTPVIFNIDLGMTHGVSFKELEFNVISNPREYENFDLFLNLTGTEDSLILEWSYNTQLYKSDTIQSWMNEYEQLLQKIVNDPHTIIKDLDTRYTSEINKIHEWNKTESKYNCNTSIANLIDNTATFYSDKTAIRSDKESYTYKQVKDYSDRLAIHIMEAGIKKGDVVCIAMSRCAAMVIAMLAVQKSGAAYLPIDPTYPEDRITFMLDDTQTKLILISSDISTGFQTHIPRLIVSETLHIQPKKGVLAEPVSGNDTAYILYTSGSTGKPKGVLLSHSNLVNFVTSMQQKIDIASEDRLIAITTISFDISCFELYLPLLQGAQVYVADQVATKDAKLLLDIVSKNQITVMQATPVTWQMMVDSEWNVNHKINTIISGGEPLSKKLTEELLLRCNTLWNGYGPTETTVYSTLKKIVHSGDITIGKPINNTTVYILDENMLLLPPGSNGEIYIGGEGVSKKGYLNRPELSAERFIPNPFDNQKTQLYRTGDIGTFLQNGDIKCMGRIDSQVKIRGYRIELGEIENVLVSIEGVKEAVVIAKEVSPDDKRLFAYIIFDNNIQNNIAKINIPNSFSHTATLLADPKITPLSHDLKKDIRTRLKKLLPDFMVPSEIVSITHFPVTPTGKIARNLLPNPLEKKSSDILNNHSLQQLTKTEKLVLNIWKDLLNTNDISLKSNFFEIGGHSLIAVKLVSLLKKETGKSLPITALFQNSTIEKLAHLIDNKNDVIELWSSYVPIKSSGSKPPIYIVHGAGLSVMVFNSLAQELDKEQPVIGLQAKGLNEMDTPLYSIEEIAGHYISEIVKHNPTGPYALAGYSFGGLIVYEMVKQLKADGKSVFLVGMLDSSISESDFHKSFSFKAYNTIYTFFKKIGYTLKLCLKDPFFIIGFRYRSLKKNIRSLLERFKIIKKSADSENVWKYTKTAFEAINTAYNNYKLTPQDCTIDLFKCDNQPYYLPDLKYLGWKPYALENLKIHDIPGDHSTIFEYPDVKQVAAKLQEVLDNSYKNYQKTENYV